ncbi:MAG: TIGR02301 family protein [Rhizobiaceae bacterium]|nr:TIGR02301 family protein [Rhizobiaceae bacterium]
MSLSLCRCVVLSLFVGLWAASGAFAQQAGSAPLQNSTPPYEDRLHRVAELVGSLHYITNLCGTAKNDQFRIKMQEFIEAETLNEPLRRKLLISKYNKGYRAFASVYTSCTDSAKLVETNYRTEGKALIEELLSRYSN